MRPPVPYYGGKQTLAPAIAALLPECDHYVEPFAGSAAVLLARRPSRMETLNDLDGDLMLFWRVLRDRPAELVRVCALTPHSRAEHAAALDWLHTYPRPALDELEHARRLWLLLAQGRAARLRRAGWRHFIDPHGSRASMPDYLLAYVDRMAAVAERLQRVSLECRPALDVIASYGSDAGVLLYVDPPYLGITRTSRQYRAELDTAAGHRELAEALNDCTAAVVLSGYDSELYRELYDDAGWYRHEIPTATCQGGSKKARTEVLWSNRPLGEQPALWDTG